MAYLILVRHGKSEWNALGKWTGWEDIPLSEDGIKEAQKAAKELGDIEIHQAYTSKLIRAKQTLEEIKKALNLSHIPTEEHEALNERHYGTYTGKNKWEVKDQIGEDEFAKLRRSWDYPIPEGESLKQVHDRTVPYYEEKIIHDLKSGKNVIIAAHGNSLRALMKHLENIPEDDIANHEIATGEIHMYEIDNDGKVITKQVRAANPNKV